MRLDNEMKKSTVNWSWYEWALWMNKFLETVPKCSSTFYEFRWRDIQKFSCSPTNCLWTLTHLQMIEILRKRWFIHALSHYLFTSKLRRKLTKKSRNGLKTSWKQSEKVYQKAIRKMLQWVGRDRFPTFFKREIGRKLLANSFLRFPRGNGTKWLKTEEESTWGILNPILNIGKEKLSEGGEDIGLDVTGNTFREPISRHFQTGNWSKWAIPRIS